jgi:hypothetical protein
MSISSPKASVERRAMLASNRSTELKVRIQLIPEPLRKSMMTSGPDASTELMAKKKLPGSRMMVSKPDPPLTRTVSALLAGVMKGRRTVIRSSPPSASTVSCSML